MKITRTHLLCVLPLLFLCLGADGDACTGGHQVVSASGVAKVSVEVEKGSDGLTIEQRNIHDRLVEDNKPGSIKHLYVISAYSGQVLIYSTVRGKVTSSGKRLTPNTTIGDTANTNSYFWVPFGGDRVATNEVLQDDGTYGTSVEYIFWWDVRGVYHQQYITGGMILHVSNQPLAVKSVVINMEVTQKSGEGYQAPPADASK